MKRAAGLLLVAFLVLGVGGSAWASNGDTLNIGGQVPLTLDLTVGATATADNLTLVGASAATTATIANIDISTNNTAGWELWVFSANAGAAGTNMINADGDPISYTVTYAGAGGVSAQPITNTGLKIGEDALNGTQTGQALDINYNQEPDYAAGYYSDQLSIVLRAK